jgi:hypothetical protein
MAMKCSFPPNTTLSLLIISTKSMKTNSLIRSQKLRGTHEQDRAIPIKKSGPWATETGLKSYFP